LIQFRSQNILTVHMLSASCGNFQQYLISYNRSALSAASCASI